MLARKIVGGVEGVAMTSGVSRWQTPATGYLDEYTHTLNPYVGCSFGCSYCYVRRMPIALFKGQPWGEWVEKKKASLQSLAGELAKEKKKGRVVIFFSSATDPYQPLEVREEVTRGLLAQMLEEPPDFVLLQTRSPLITRDIDLLTRMKPGSLRVSMTVESDREDVRRAVTPSAPPYKARLEALRKLVQAGIPVQIAVSPLLPHTTGFAAKLALAASRIVVDDYFRGDGSEGRRSRALGMPALYEANGWSEWYSPVPADKLREQLTQLLPPEAVGFSSAGFAPPKA